MCTDSRDDQRHNVVDIYDLWFTARGFPEGNQRGNFKTGGPQVAGYRPRRSPSRAGGLGRRRKTFVFQHKVNGARHKRETIGHFSQMSVQDARHRAVQLYALYTGGHDPSELTLQRALEDHLLRLQNKGGSARTVKDMRSEIGKHLGDWLKKPVRTISRRECYQRHLQIGKDFGNRKGKA